MSNSLFISKQLSKRRAAPLCALASFFVLLLVPVCLNPFKQFEALAAPAKHQQQMKASNVQQAANMTLMLDQMLGQVTNITAQANSAAKNNLVDKQTTANMSNALNELVANMRKVLADNKKLQSQLQEATQRVSNVTGVATNFNLNDPAMAAQGQALTASLLSSTTNQTLGMLQRLPTAGSGGALL